MPQCQIFIDSIIDGNAYRSSKRQWNIHEDQSVDVMNLSSDAKYPNLVVGIVAFQLSSFRNRT